MEDYVPFEEEPADPSLALVMKDCNFSWVNHLYLYPKAFILYNTFLTFLLQFFFIL